jgi:hypothetical protein
MDERAAVIKGVIQSSADRLAEEILAEQYALQSELSRRYSHSQRETCLQDITYHLSYLAEAIANAQPATHHSPFFTIRGNYGDTR